MEDWLKWAMEIQSLAQAGLTYTHDVYDVERYERLREIAAEMLSCKTDMPVEKVKTLFCGETGYQTPKIDTRAAVFKVLRHTKVKTGRFYLISHEYNFYYTMEGKLC